MKNKFCTMENFNIKNYEYIDFHSHMHDKAFNADSDEVMQNISDKKIVVLTIGTDIEESRKAKELSDRYENIFYTIGVHPHDNLEAEFDQEEFEKLLSNKCIAVGECGLDYFYEAGLSEEEVKNQRDRQEKLFRHHIEFAIKHNLPLMIHGRPKEGDDAYVDIIKILREYKSIYQDKIRGNMHFFAGSKEIARECIELGFTFSFGGVLTLTQDYDEVVKSIPIEYIHAETDAPYVSPKGKDGKKVSRRNSSEYVPIIIEKIAELKGLSAEGCKEKLKENFVRFISN